MDRMTAAWVDIIATRKPSGRWAKEEWRADEMNLQPDTWYRTLYYNDDHLSDPRYPELALCGKTLSDPIHDAIYELAALKENPLPGIVFHSQRKGGKCSQCRSTWKDARDVIEKDAQEMQAVEQTKADAVRNSREADLTAESKNPKRRMARHQVAIAAAIVKREFGAVEVEAA